MTVSHDVSQRGLSRPPACLEDKFEVIKEIGDGSFGSVSLARVRTAGAHVARRGSLVSKVPCSYQILYLTRYLDRHQNHEEDIRIIHTLS